MHRLPAIRVVAGMVPLRMTNLRPGAYVYDLGQNVSGWVRLRVKGPAGSALQLRHAELLYDDGTLNVENLRRPRATHSRRAAGGAGPSGASGSIETLRGTVVSSWSRTPKSLRLEIRIPAGATAEVHIPKLNFVDLAIDEGARAVWQNGAYVAGTPA